MHRNIIKIWRENWKAKALHFCYWFRKEESPNIRWEGFSSIFCAWFVWQFIMPLAWVTNRHEGSLILSANPSTSLTQPCWLEYAKDSKIKIDEISRISTSYKPIQNSRCKHYWCYVFLKASSKFTKHIWWSSTISPSQSIRIWRAHTSLCVR